MGKRAPPEIHEDLIERLALGLVDRQRPGQAHRVLRERTEHLRLNPIQVRIIGKPNPFPGVGTQPSPITVVELDLERLVRLAGIERRDDADIAIDPAACRIIGQQHDPGARLERQERTRGQRAAAKLAPHRAPTRHRLPGQAGQVGAIDVLRVGIRRHQVHQAGLACRHVHRVDPRVEEGQTRRAQRAGPDGLQHRDKGWVLLPVHMRQFHHPQGQGLHRPGIKEIRAAIIGGKHRRIVGRHHGRQLIEIPDEQHLDAAKRPGRPRPVQPQEHIHAIQEISAHHGDFIDDDGVKLLEQGRLPHRALADLLHRNVRPETEEAMNGLALHLDRGHTRRCEDDQALGRRGTEIVQQGGFAGARPAGQKHRGPGVLQQPEHVRRFGMQRQLGLGMAPCPVTLSV